MGKLKGYNGWILILVALPLLIIGEILEPTPYEPTLTDSSETALSEKTPETVGANEPSYCTVGWKCKDDSTSGYQHSNCSWSDLEDCNHGCKSGTCEPVPCSKGYLDETRCDGDTLQQNYQYSDCSTYWKDVEVCEFGCEDGSCQEGCKGGYLNTYRCDGDYRERKYRYSDCSTDWIEVEYCEYGCSEGECEESQCVEGYLDETRCEGNTVQQRYQKEDCSLEWEEIECCEYGCIDGVCKEGCEEGYLDEYRCEGDYLERKYQCLNCSTNWIEIEYCEYGCGFEECEAGCEAGYTDEYTCSGDWLKRKYLNTDCSYDWNEYELCEYGCENDECLSEPEESGTVTVSSVTDGDTLKLSTGETVRLIGINTPESGEVCYTEAKDELITLTLGKEVTLESDVEDQDQYGRLLRYIYVGDTFVNVKLVRLGLAHKYEYGSNTKYSALFEQAEEEAKQNEGCLWETSQENYIVDQCISITNFHYDADGNDNYNLNDEYVTFKNECGYSIDMGDWSIKDDTASHRYTFPDYTFEAGAIVTLYTGTGTDNTQALYWGRTSGSYAAIWNNDGDTLYLRDTEGSLVLTRTY